MDDRYASLTPPQLIASLRSMPRRFTEALELAAPRTPDEVIGLVASDIGALLGQLGVLDEAIHTTADHIADPLPVTVDQAVADAGGGNGAIVSDAVLSGAREALDAIEVVTQRIADRLDRLSADDWNRAAYSPTTAYTLTELAQGAVRVAADRLRVTERAISAASTG